MARKWTFALLVLVLALAVVPGAWAKEQYAYSVKFVCGYNPTNVGESLNGNREGEPPVKFGNYATEINIVWPELYVNDSNKIFKHLLVLVDKGVPVGREPKVIEAKTYIDSVELKPFRGTMDDCNRIAELLWGSAPTPYPLTIGYLIITSVYELDVTAVYTAQACSNWVNDNTKLPCLDDSGRQQGVSISEDVEKIEGRKLILSTTGTPEPIVQPPGAGAKK
jgi:hypothetical protein